VPSDEEIQAVIDVLFNMGSLRYAYEVRMLDEAYKFSSCRGLRSILADYQSVCRRGGRRDSLTRTFASLCVLRWNRQREFGKRGRRPSIFTRLMQMPCLSVRGSVNLAMETIVKLSDTLRAVERGAPPQRLSFYVTSCRSLDRLVPQLRKPWMRLAEISGALKLDAPHNPTNQFRGRRQTSNFPALIRRRVAFPLPYSGHSVEAPTASDLRTSAWQRALYRLGEHCPQESRLLDWQRLSRNFERLRHAPSMTDIPKLYFQLLPHPGTFVRPCLQPP
jgi:hypothetical protein